MIAYTFETNVLRSMYGHEQRSALYGWPRRTVKYDVTFMSEAQAAYFTRVVNKYQGSVFGVPVWGEQGNLSAQASASQTYVDLIDVDKMNFEVGGLFVLFADYETYEVREIDSMTTTRLNFSTGLSSTWPIGSTLYPMLHMTVEQNIPSTKLTSAYGGSGLVFKEAWNGDIVHELGSQSFPFYKEYVVFNKRPNWIDNVGVSITRSSEYLQKLGVQIRYTRDPESEFVLEASYLSTNIDECAELKGWFNYCMGKWSQFWIPTWQRDIVVTGAISSSDTILTIEDIEYATYWANNNSVGKYLFLLLPDDTEVYREITAWPSSTQITVDEEIGYDVSADSVQHVLASFLLPARFEIDEMEMQYYRPTVATTKARMQSLHTETMTRDYVYLPLHILVDENDDLTVGDYQVSVDSLRRDRVTYMYKDYGVDYFSDFEVHFEMYIEDTWYEGKWGLFLVSNTPGTLQDQIDSNDGVGWDFFYTAGRPWTYLRDKGGVLTSTVMAIAANYVLPIGPYFIIAKRRGDQFTIEVYTDEEHTALYSTRTGTVTTDKMRYLLVMSNREQGSTTTNWSGYHRNYTIVGGDVVTTTTTV
jgi:hypothetical protein